MNIVQEYIKYLYGMDESVFPMDSPHTGKEMDFITKLRRNKKCMRNNSDTENKLQKLN